MRYLFIHQNFPGQFLHIIRHLLAKGDNEIVFISMPSNTQMEQVRHAVYRLNLPPHRQETVHPAANEFDLAMRRAEQVAITATNIKNLGFEPDIIIGHEGWGELLNISDVFPGVPVLGYFEFFYHTDRNDVGFDPEFPMHSASFPNVRSKNGVNLLALQNPVYGQTPTRFQLETYPEWARDKITILREGVDLELCYPDPTVKKKDFVFEGEVFSPNTKLVTYVSRNFEPYRGFNKFMRALPKILEEREDVQVVLVGGDSVSYGSRLPNGTWREMMMNEVGSKLDLSRVHFFSKVPYSEFCRLLQRSDAHVYLTYPFVVSWSLREALASGCSVIASATAPVEELITHMENGYLVPFHEPEKIAEGVLTVLNDQLLAHKISKNARSYAETHLSLADYLRNYDTLINRVIEEGRAARGSHEEPAGVSAPPPIPEPSPVEAVMPEGAQPVAEPPASETAKKPAVVVMSVSSKSSKPAAPAPQPTAESSPTAELSPPPEQMALKALALKKPEEEKSELKKSEDGKREEKQDVSKEKPAVGPLVGSPESSSGKSSVGSSVRSSGSSKRDSQDSSASFSSDSSSADSSSADLQAISSEPPAKPIVSSPKTSELFEGDAAFSSTSPKDATPKGARSEVTSPEIASPEVTGPEGGKAEAFKRSVKMSKAKKPVKKGNKIGEQR
ncbi:glycosyltransferase family 4 protein [Entomobacter blattae]|uniref:D-inositol-3-phosphate glycosyltransferase n=1 Tax=Entomobacter blattae TaxID=2762277 RepID=A0A7H1NQZ7_9PROT|nr:glycosyltransferase family 4 protein [Entomobacter blattae]QNT78207.1 D-inositol-3-phosphate glycosyltransferase [Entomobacter blattae]